MRVVDTSDPPPQRVRGSAWQSAASRLSSQAALRSFVVVSRVSVVVSRVSMVRMVHMGCMVRMMRMVRVVRMVRMVRVVRMVRMVRMVCIVRIVSSILSGSPSRNQHAISPPDDARASP